MKKTRIAVAQTEWQGTRKKMVDTIRALVSESASRDANIVCLQEFTLSPYFASVIGKEGYQWAEPLHGGETDQVLGALAEEHGVHIIGSIFEKDGDNYWDTATLHAPSGELAGFTRKVHIPEGIGYHENHYFDGYDAYPVHDTGRVKVAIPTCYDQWFPEMSRICALNGAEFIFYPTAIGSEPTAPDVDSSAAWQTVMRGQAVANGVYIAAANRTGTEGVEFYGSSFICDPMGNILAQASRDKTEVITADLDPATFAQFRDLFPLLHQRRPDVYKRLLETPTEDVSEKPERFN